MSSPTLSRCPTPPSPGDKSKPYSLSPSTDYCSTLVLSTEQDAAAALWRSLQPQDGEQLQVQRLSFTKSSKCQSILCMCLPSSKVQVNFHHSTFRPQESSFSWTQKCVVSEDWQHVVAIFQMLTKYSFLKVLLKTFVEKDSSRFLPALFDIVLFDHIVFALFFNGFNVLCP